jgi:hypothetical protein
MTITSRTTRTARAARPTEPLVPEGLPEWARMAYTDIAASARSLGSIDLLDELAEAYLSLGAPEDRCWPARAYWRELGVYMGESRRRRLALARLWPEFLRFRQGRRSASCTAMRALLLAGGFPRGIDAVHAARCEHCHMFSIYLSA